MKLICAILGAAAPDLPTVGESLPGFVLRTMQSAPIQARLPTGGARFIPTTPEQFGAFVKAEIAKRAPVVRASGARVE